LFNPRYIAYLESYCGKYKDKWSILKLYVELLE